MTSGSRSPASSSIASAASAIAGWWSRRSRRWACPVVGALPRNEKIALPERHLGLVQAGETEALEARLEAIADFIETHVDCGRVLALAGALDCRFARAGARRGSAAGTAHRARARRGVLVHLSASRARLAGGRGRDRPVLAARRRAAAFRLRRLLASGRLSGIARRAAGGGGALSRGLTSFRRDASGAWRMRGLYGAGPKPDRRLRRRSSDGGPARRRNQFRKAPDDARLSRGPHRVGLRAWDRGRWSCAATSSTMRPSSRAAATTPLPLFATSTARRKRRQAREEAGSRARFSMSSPRRDAQRLSSPCASAPRAWPRACPWRRRRPQPPAARCP